MKLKKIASLMLAGVMAISMLAGCSGTEKAPITEVPTDSSFADAMNAEQDKNADVVLNFTYDNSLESMMKKALEIYGTNVTAGDVKGQIINMLDAQNTNVSDPDRLAPGTLQHAADVWYYVDVWECNDNRTDKAYYEDIAESVDLTKLPADNDTYVANAEFTYEYTANVAVIKFENKDGKLQHYAAVVVACDTTVKAV